MFEKKISNIMCRSEFLPRDIGRLLNTRAAGSKSGRKYLPCTPTIEVYESGVHPKYIEANISSDDAASVASIKILPVGRICSDGSLFCGRMRTAVKQSLRQRISNQH